MGLAHAMLGCCGGELGPGGDVQLGEHVRQMSLYGPARHVEPVADLRVGQPLGDQGGDGLLGRGETAPAGLGPVAMTAATAAYARLAQLCLRPGQVTHSAEALVDADRLIEQRAGAVDVSASAPYPRGAPYTGLVKAAELTCARRAAE